MVLWLLFIGFEFYMNMEDTGLQSGKKVAKKPKNKKSVPFTKRLRVVLLNLLAMLLVLVALPFLALEWIDSYTNHGETYEVPDVCGVTLDDAVVLLGDRNLSYTVVERRYKPNAKESEIVVQYPVPGTRVKEGRKIGLVVNTTVKPKRSVPSVIDNRTYREAESHIKAAGFVIEAIDTIPGEKDWVYVLRYDGKQLVNGEAIPQGASITVVIGSGSAESKEEEPVFDSIFDI